MQQTRVPPLPARLGLACYNCFKEEEVKLSRCTGCFRVSYCTPECQKNDWKTHKPMCKALSAIEKNNPIAAAALLFSLSPHPTTELNVLHNMGESHASNISSFCQRSLGRNLTIPERNLVGWEPRCMACTRTDQIMRIEAAKSGGTSTAQKPRQLIPCPRCNLSFCCSPAHWAAALPLHDAPCEDGHDGLSQCALNREVRGDVLLEAAIADSHDASGVFRWAPDRTAAAWASVAAAGMSWETEIADEMRRSVGVPPERPMAPWVRMASNALTMPMTILYALEKLHDDDAWTKKSTLTIHILGATAEEITSAMVFEEILHRLPDVKTLKLLFCGPEISGGRMPRVISMDTCPECTRRGRKRVHEHTADTYHGYVDSQGTKFAPPDLAIAFNSGASQESTHTWPPTFKVLVARKIRALFTAYNREEAEAEAGLLRTAGARLHPALGPGKNPWGSSKLIPEPSKVYGFYAVNGWLAGGFK
ncbi:hypothetical protein GGX14DRAFT_507204 [Mycena pura]|uniref:MYND-type domain-containing protein n=1 Tax=Mycena pura TaxID=153505 RepID=A0AAD6URN7_9AGAR|nr:hypothetical protein GGX14DRAFT_507204 [Mycena pura]